MSEPGRSPDFCLLIVDDNEQNLYTLRALIERHCTERVELIEATSGRAAIELASQNPSIDLIILDVQMPDLDGFQTASLLKVRKRTRDIPVIFLTAAFKTEEFQQKGYALGAADYLLKPIDDNLLINKLSAYFRLIRRERELNRELEAQVARRTAELREARGYLASVIDTMGEALLVLNPDGTIKRVNPAACALLGYDDATLTTLSIGDVFEEEQQEQARAFMGEWLQALIRTGVLDRIEASFIRQDGERVPILFSRRAMREPGGAITDIICIAKDMTGYRRIDDDD
ncbi:MAG: response regulator [Chromatiales bacterium]|nr:response regulator [Chromatiales bacterium]